MTRHQASPVGSHSGIPTGDRRAEGWSSEYERIFLLNARARHRLIGRPAQGKQARKLVWL